MKPSRCLKAAQERAQSEVEPESTLPAAAAAPLLSGTAQPLDCAHWCSASLIHWCLQQWLASSSDICVSMLGLGWGGVGVGVGIGVGMEGSGVGLGLDSGLVGSR